jgi:hypothetical protein
MGVSIFKAKQEQENLAKLYELINVIILECLAQVKTDYSITLEHDFKMDSTNRHTIFITAPEEEDRYEGGFVNKYIILMTPIVEEIVSSIEHFETKSGTDLYQFYNHRIRMYIESELKLLIESKSNDIFEQGVLYYNLNKVID